MKKNNKIEELRQKYRQHLSQNPPIFDKETGTEMKECQGCYCQLLADDHNDFCFDCLDGETSCCVENTTELTSKCLACYCKKSRFKTKKPRKVLTFLQKQRLYWELQKQIAQDRIEEIKAQEEPNWEIQTAREIENIKRWSEQEKKRILKELSTDELLAELKKRK